MTLNSDVPSSQNASSVAGRNLDRKRWPDAIAFIPLLVTLLATTLLYLPIHRFQFSIIDDDANVFNNIYIRDPHAQNIAYFWLHPYYELYMPLTSTIWALLARIAVLRSPHTVPPGGAYTSILDPSVFHVASLILHVGVTAVVFLILRRLRFGGWPSAAGALLFSVHPIQIQAVAWITGMNNLTGAFFGLLAVYVYSLQVDDSTNPSASNSPVGQTARVTCLVASTVLFVGALLSKPTTIVIPVFLAILEHLVWRRAFRRWAAVIGGWMILALVCGLITRAASAGATAFVWSPLWGRPFIVGDALAFYLLKLTLPFNLTFDYSRSPHLVLAHWWGYATWVVPAALFWLLWRQSATKSTSEIRESMSPESKAWLWVSILIFASGLLPTLGIIPNYSQVVSSVFDRYLYLAMLGPAFLIAHMLSRRYSVQLAVTAAVWVILAFFAWQTALQLPDWTDMSTQTAQILRVNPQSAIGHHDRGMILGAADDLRGAVREFDTEVRLQHGTNARADFYLGVTLVEMGYYADAVLPLHQAYSAARSDYEYWYQYWNALALTNRLGEAEAVVREHLALVPTDGRAQFTLGKMLVARGDPAAALPFLQKAAIRLPNEPAVAFFTGAAFEKLGYAEQAIAAYERAVKLDPGRQETKDALNRLRRSR